MPSSRKTLVVGSLVLSLARVWSVRQHINSSWSTPGKGSWSLPEPSWKKNVPTLSSVVEQIDALLRQQGMEVDEMTRGMASKGDSSVPARGQAAFVKGLYTLAKSIATDIENKIKHDQSATQQKMDLLNHNLYIADKSTTAAKQAADQEDKATFECVAAEQSKRVGAESAEKSLTDSRSNEKEACQLQQDNSGFSFDGSASGNSRLQFACEVGKGECDLAHDQLQQDLRKMYQDAQLKMIAKKAAWSKMKMACEAKEKERVQAQSSLGGAESAWNSQKQTCLKLAPHREETMCVYGSSLQSKCKAEDDYKQLVASSKKAQGGADSEVDREQKWKCVATTKCLVRTFILNMAVTSADVKSCVTQVNFGKDVGYLNRREKEFAAFAASNTCSAGQIRFFNGQSWTVPAGAKPKSSEYVRSPFKPQISLTGNAFDFCTASSIRAGATLHMVENGECGVNLVGAHSRTVDHIDSTRYHEGARAGSWGCDRVTQLKDLEVLTVGSKQYLVSHC